MTRAEIAPIRSEPIKITPNSYTPVASSTPMDDYSALPDIITISYITMATASLKILSPNIIALRLTSASISLKIASTDTGSVALIKLPNANASFHVNSGLNEVYPTNQNKIELVKIAIKVPKKLYIRIVPPF
jgi:hypothetical protein